MLAKKKWTVGYVNFHTAIYLKWQLKILYEFNHPEEFDVILIDNSSVFETEALKSLEDQYSAYGNINVIYNKLPIPDGKGSAHHALGIELVVEHANSDYLLIQDPDFFWVKRNYLRIFAAYLDKGYIAMGAPYRRPVGFGASAFPTAFGCAHRLADLEKKDFYPATDKDILESVNAAYPYPEFEFSADVGWKVRERLSNSGAPFISFEQRDATELSKLMGEHSFESSPCEYFLNGSTIAFHLFRGSFPTHVNNLTKESIFSPPKKWVDVREKYAKTFYNLAKNNSNKFILSLKRNIVSYFHGPQLEAAKNEIFFMQNYKYKRKDIKHYWNLLEKKSNYLEHQVEYIKKNLDLTEVELTKLEKDTNCFERAVFFDRSTWKITQKKPLLRVKNCSTQEEKPATKLLIELDQLILNLSYLIAETQIRMKKKYINKQIAFVSERMKFSQEFKLDEQKSLMDKWSSSTENSPQLIFKNTITNQILSFDAYHEALHKLILNNDTKIQAFLKKQAAQIELANS